MKITLLIDNEAHPQQARLHHEHGLSMYFQADGLHWLLDTIEACSAYCKTNKIKACIGGAHLPNKTESSAWELNEEIRDLGRGLLKTYPEMQLITGHCTGKHAQGLLKEVMQQQVQTFYSGCTLEV